MGAYIATMILIGYCILFNTLSCTVQSNGWNLKVSCLRTLIGLVLLLGVWDSHVDSPSSKFCVTQ